MPALTVTTLTDVTPQGFVDDPLSSRRLGELGRAAQTTIGSLDAGLELAQGTTSYIYLGGRIVQGWAIQLVLLTALLPFAIGAIDLFARCRRRRIKLAPAARSLRSRLVFWGYGALLLFVAAQLGAFPEGEARPLPPDAGVYQPSPVVLGVLGALLLVGWLVVRQPLIPRRPARLEEALAGHTVALLALGLAALVVVATNPYSLVYLLPSLYAWLWLPQIHNAGPPPARAGLLVLGLAGPVVLLLSFATRLDLGLETPWYLLSLVAVGYVPWIAVLVGVVWLAVAGSAGRARRRALRALSRRAASAAEPSPGAAFATPRRGPSRADALEG